MTRADSRLLVRQCPISFLLLANSHKPSLHWVMPGRGRRRWRMKKPRSCKKPVEQRLPMQGRNSALRSRGRESLLLPPRWIHRRRVDDARFYNISNFTDPQIARPVGRRRAACSCWENPLSAEAVARKILRSRRLRETEPTFRGRRRLPPLVPSLAYPRAYLHGRPSSYSSASTLGAVSSRYQVSETSETISDVSTTSHV